MKDLEKHPYAAESREKKDSLGATIQGAVGSRSQFSALPSSDIEVSRS